MKAAGITLDDMLKASKEANGNSSGGFMYEYGNEYIVKGIGRTNDVGEIGKAIIKTVNGNPVKIEDVAEVKIGAAPKIGDGSLKGKPAVIMTVMKQPATNTLELTKSIDAAIRSEEHTSELQSLMRISYAVFCLKKKNTSK